MDTFTAVINRWPNAVAFASDLQISPVRARAWRNRNSVPASMWRRLEERARARGFNDITVELLADIAAHQPDEQAA